MKTSRLLVAACATAPLLCLSTALATAAPTPMTSTGTQRIAGADRYATSAAVSAKSFTSPQGAVFVASGQNFPDALAGGAAAAKQVGPLLLTSSSRLSGATSNELKRLRPSKIYILGGTGAVSGATAVALNGIAPTQRIGGADRYATAANTSKAIFTSASTVYIASGLGFADALAGGPAAAKQAAPMLLTSATSLPAATRAELTRLQPTAVKILGGNGAVSSRVQSQIQAAVPSARITRYSGADRYATAASVAKAMWPNGSRTVFYASGTSFPDGLSATPSAAVNKAPLLLTSKSCMPSPTASASASLSPSLRVFVGGTGVVTTSGTICGSTPVAPTPPPPPPTPPSPPSVDYDCGDFSTWPEAQAVFDRYYPAYGHVFRLDRDGDLIACEDLPGAP